MVAVLAAKYICIAFISITLGGATIGTGILFSGYNLAASRNPDESENLFNSSLMAFALIETFVFLSFLVGIIGFSI